MPDMKPCPCPFCGANSNLKGGIIRTDRKDVWKHWYVGCVLDGFTIKDVEKWNRRAGERKEGDDNFEDRADGAEKPYDRAGDDAESDVIDDPKWKKCMMQKFVGRR